MKKFKQLEKETEKLLEEMGAEKRGLLIDLSQVWKLKGVYNNFNCHINTENGMFTIFGCFDRTPFGKWMNPKFNFHRVNLNIGDIKTYLSIVNDILNLKNPPYIDKSNI